MANEIRVRSDFKNGTITDNPLTNVATTINSAAFANLPVVDATNHLMLVLDPTGVAGAPEVVKVTTHTAAATSVTVVRGQAGTTGRQHATGTIWRHGPIASDFPTICTVATRPTTDLFEGRLIYETDTDKHLSYTGAAWQDAVPLGAWEPWAPTLANMTLGNGTVLARYTKHGRSVRARFRFTLGSSSAMGTNPTFSLPVAADLSATPVDSYLGEGLITDISSVLLHAFSQLITTTTANLRISTANGTYVNFANITATAPFVWAATHYVEVVLCYEAAA